MERLLGGRRKKCDRKLATTERDDHSLERIVRSNRFNNLVEITGECQNHGFTRFKSNNPPPTAGDGLPQLHSSDQAPSELQTKAEVSRLVNRKEELDGGSLEKCSTRMKASFVSHSEIKDRREDY